MSGNLDAEILASLKAMERALTGHGSGIARYGFGGGTHPGSNPQNFGNKAVGLGQYVANAGIYGMSRGTGMLAHAANTASAVSGADMPGLVAGLSTLERYNKALLTTSAQFAKYNVGIVEVESRLKSLTSVTGATREQTLLLLSTYEKGFRYTSLENAEKLFKNIRNVVGANQEAMQEYMGTIQSLSEKFPSLERSLTRLDGQDKIRLKSQADLLLATGQISLAENKRIRDYIAGNTKAKTADEERKQAAQEQIDATNKLRQVFEQINIAIGQTLIPYVQKLAEWMKTNVDAFTQWVPKIVAAAAALKALQVATGVLGSVGSFAGGLRRGIMGSDSNPNEGLATGRLGKLMRGGSSILGGVGGAAAGYGTSVTIDALYEKYTGHKASAMSGMEQAGKVLGSAGAGAISGGMLGGPAGAAIGAIAGAVSGIFQTLKGIYDHLKATLKDAANQSDPSQTKSVFDQSAAARGKLADEAKLNGAPPEVVAAFKKQQQLLQAKAANMAEDTRLSREQAEKTSKLGFWDSLELGKGHWKESKAVTLDNEYSQKRLANRNAFAPQQKELEDAQRVTAAYLADQARKQNQENDRRSAEQARRQQAATTQASAEKTEVPAAIADATNRAQYDANYRSQMLSTANTQSLNARVENDKVQNTAQFGLDASRDDKDIGKVIQQMPEVLKQGSIAATEANISAMKDFIGVFDKRLGEIAKEKVAAQAAGDTGRLNLLGREEQKITEQRGAVAEVTDRTVSRRQGIVGAQDAVAGVEAQQIDVQRNSLQAANQLLQEQSGLYSTIIEKTAVTGQVNMPEINKQHDAAVAAIHKQYDAALQLANVMDERMVRAQQSLNQQIEDLQGQLAAAGNDEKKRNEILAALAERRRDADLIDTQIAQGRLQIANTMEQREKALLDAALKRTQVYEGQIGYSQSETDLMASQITIMDSLGAGVKASAEARMQVADHLRETISLQQKQLGLIDEEIAKAEQAGDGDKVLALRQRRLETETAITQSQQRQLEITKALRDNYVSAIAAMSTGAGVFQKIVVDQEKNFGGFLGTTRGAVQSLTTGGLSRGGVVAGSDNIVSMKADGSGNLSVRGDDRDDRYMDIYNANGGIGDRANAMMRETRQAAMNGNLATVQRNLGQLANKTTDFTATALSGAGSAGIGAVVEGGKNSAGSTRRNDGVNNLGFRLEHNPARHGSMQRGFGGPMAGMDTSTSSIDAQYGNSHFRRGGLAHSQPSRYDRENAENHKQHVERQVEQLRNLLASDGGSAANAAVAKTAEPSASNPSFGVRPSNGHDNGTAVDAKGSTGMSVNVTVNGLDNFAHKVADAVRAEINKKGAGNIDVAALVRAIMGQRAGHSVSANQSGVG